MSKRGKFDFLAETRQERVEESQVELPAEPVTESAHDSERTSAQRRKSTEAQSIIERRPSGQRIRADLLRAYKIMAAEMGVPQYVLIEEALELYLAEKRKP